MHMHISLYYIQFFDYPKIMIIARILLHLKVILRKISERIQNINIMFALDHSLIKKIEIILIYHGVNETKIMVL